MKDAILRHMMVVALLLVGFSTVSAVKNTEKTFLDPQPLRIPAQHTFYDYATHLLQNKDCIGWDHVQAIYFYQDQENCRSLGEYFGRNHSNVITLGSNKTDFPVANFIFSQNPQDLKLKGSFSIAPHREVKGFHLSYIKRISPISNSLFFQIHSPVVRVTTCMNARVHEEKADVIDNQAVGVLTYFSGCLEQKAAATKQERLKYAKIPCCDQDSKVGFADVTCELAYNLGNGDYYFKPFVGVVIPTGKRPEGKVLFEPLLGNGKRWGVNFGLEAMQAVEVGDETMVDLTASLQLQHLFDVTQKRTLGIRSDDWGNVRKWSHYELLGEQDKKGVFPAANVLTRDVKVKSGLATDCYLNCNILRMQCMVNFGYNYFSRPSESISVKCWQNDKYALVSSNYDANNPFNINSTDALQGAIQKEMLDLTVAQNEAQASHKLYVMVSYVQKEIPFSIGVGGAYELVQGNAALSGYELYLRCNISF